MQQDADINSRRCLLETLWKNWLKNTLLDELRRIDSIKGQTGKGKRNLTIKKCPMDGDKESPRLTPIDKSRGYLGPDNLVWQALRRQEAAMNPHK